MSFPPPTPGQARLIWLALGALAAAILAGVSAGVLWGLGEVLHLLSPVLWPLAVAGVLAYLLDPVVDFFERKGVSRQRAILSVFALALVALVAFIASVVPQLVMETRDLAERVPSYAKGFEQK